jgi:hypothetical protein
MVVVWCWFYVPNQDMKREIKDRHKKTRHEDGLII